MAYDPYNPYNAPDDPNNPYNAVYPPARRPSSGAPSSAMSGEYVPPPSIQQQKQQQSLIDKLRDYKMLSDMKKEFWPSKVPGASSSLSADSQFGGSPYQSGIFGIGNTSGASGFSYGSPAGASMAGPLSGGISTTGAGGGIGYPSSMMNSSLAPGSLGGKSGGMSSLGGGNPGMLYAYLISQGKLMENRALKNNPDDFGGNFGMATLGPSIAQMNAGGPKGIASGIFAPMLSPWLMSDKAKQTKPEWAGAMGK